MLQQQLRMGGLALATAVATATLALVTVLVSNLVLTVVAGLGGIAPPPRADPDPRSEVQGVLLSARTETDQDPEQVCRRVTRKAGGQAADVGAPPGKDRPVRCHERHAQTGGARP